LAIHNFEENVANIQLYCSTSTAILPGLCVCWSKSLLNLKLKCVGRLFVFTNMSIYSNTHNRWPERQAEGDGIHPSCSCRAKRLGASRRTYTQGRISPWKYDGST